MANRNIITLITDLEDTSPRAMQDREIAKAFELISIRSNNGTIDEEDISFIKARRDYLTDDQLGKIIGMTYAEIEAEIEAGAEAGLSKMTKAELITKATEMGIELSGDEKKDDLIALIENA